MQKIMKKLHKKRKRVQFIMLKNFKIFLIISELQAFM